jgi:hypothetical protein
MMLDRDVAAVSAAILLSIPQATANSSASTARSIRPETPLNLEDAKRIVGGLIDRYNTVRLHSALGSVTQADRRAARHHAIFAARDKNSKRPERTVKSKANNQPAVWHPLPVQLCPMLFLRAPSLP